MVGTTRPDNGPVVRDDDGVRLRRVVRHTSEPLRVRLDAGVRDKDDVRDEPTAVDPAALRVCERSTGWVSEVAHGSCPVGPELAVREDVRWVWKTTGDPCSVLRLSLSDATCARVDGCKEGFVEGAAEPDAARRGAVRL